MTKLKSNIKLDDICFPDKALVAKNEIYGKSYAFYNTMVDVIVSENGDMTKYLLKVSNRGMVRHPLKIHFKTDRKLAYVPNWLHNPPIYELKKKMSFAHYGLPLRTGVDESAIPADLPFAICFNSGKNPDCVMVGCESVDKGVGIELENGGVTFCFLDGTERSSWDLEFYVSRGLGLIDCLRKYQKNVPYQGIKSEDSQMMWFFDTQMHYGKNGKFDINLFRRDAEEIAKMGAKYVVIEARHHGQHYDGRYWSPKNGDRVPEVGFIIKALDIMEKLGMKPLMYYNCVHGIMGLMNHPEFGTPDLHRMRFKPADGGLAQKKMQESMNVDMNWFKDGVKPVIEYPIDSDPIMDVRCAEWRDWLCRRITFMLKNYPQMAGTYIDTWPAGLPFFGESLNIYDDCYDGNSWWNAMNDFMWDIRQVTRSFDNKILMLNDSRMPKKVMESADVILNEDAGPISSPEGAFWHCFRSMAVGHGSKPGYQFHHAKPGMRNDTRAKLMMACSTAMGLGYCIIHFNFRHKEDKTDTKKAYNAAVDKMKWTGFETSKDIPEMTISKDSKNIESLSFKTDNHQVEIDFPKKKLTVNGKIT